MHNVCRQQSAEALTPRLFPVFTVSLDCCTWQHFLFISREGAVFFISHIISCLDIARVGSVASIAYNMISTHSAFFHKNSQSKLHFPYKCHFFCLTRNWLSQNHSVINLVVCLPITNDRSVQSRGKLVKFCDKFLSRLLDWPDVIQLTSVENLGWSQWICFQNTKSFSEKHADLLILLSSLHICLPSIKYLSFLTFPLPTLPFVFPLKVSPTNYPRFRW